MLRLFLSILLIFVAKNLFSLELKEGYRQDGSLIYREIDKAFMVIIPAGDYFIGSEDPLHLDFEKPSLYQKTKEFLIDQNEVAIKQYLACVKSGACKAIDSLKQENLDYPVNYVSWEDAYNYCQWVGAELASESQWEIAARGKNSTIYPSGLKPLDLVYELRPLSKEANLDGFGLFNLSGNLSEWVKDSAPILDNKQLLPRKLSELEASSRRVEDYVFLAESEYKIIKGASFKTAFKNFQRASFRRFQAKGFKADWLGFRCAYSPK